MRCLITGGAGFIGSHVAELLLTHGCSVTIVDSLATGRKENIIEGASFIQRDISEGIEDLCHQIEWIFHLAGLADIVLSIEQP